jgi:hypothetical protein
LRLLPPFRFPFRALGPFRRGVVAGLGGASGFGTSGITVTVSSHPFTFIRAFTSQISEKIINMPPWVPSRSFAKILEKIFESADPESPWEGGRERGSRSAATFVALLREQRD